MWTAMEKVRPPDGHLRAMTELKRIFTLASATADFPVVDMREDLVAASAVDLVIAQLHRNERGVQPTVKSYSGWAEWSLT